MHAHRCAQVDEMTLDTYEVIALFAAVAAILMLGTTHLRLNLTFYCLHTLAIAAETAWISYLSGEPQHLIAAAGVLVKALGIPIFLGWIIRKLDVDSDVGTYLPAPLCMHLGIVMLGVSYLLSNQIPGVNGDDATFGATSAIGILFCGILLMLTRKVAISQIVGFLVIENGIYLFALTQTRGMPLIIEMGLLLEVLVAVMITGLLLFNIKKSFEHIDVTQLTELRDQ